jgi:hypothetical protein
MGKKKKTFRASSLGGSDKRPESGEIAYPLSPWERVRERESTCLQPMPLNREPAPDSAASAAARRAFATPEGRCGWRRGRERPMCSCRAAYRTNCGSSNAFRHCGLGAMPNDNTEPSPAIKP